MRQSLFKKLILITSLTFIGSNWVYFQALAKSEVAMGKNIYLDTQNYDNPVKKTEPPKVIFTQPQSQIESTTTQPVVNNHKIAKLSTEIGFPLLSPMAISSTFGWRRDPFTGVSQLHDGVDFAVPIGTPVLAVADGEVSTSGGLNGYGLIVIIRHNQKTRESRYAHLSQVLVKPGEQIQAGTIIGFSGNTGFSTGPHLHFEWRELEQGNWIATDPSMLLAQANAKMLKAQAEKEALNKFKPSDYSRAPRKVESVVTNNLPVSFALQLPDQVNSILRRRFFGLPEHF
jgi:murein DD-endopeptidase MepM/ murein hydrolase activator NlpD